MIQSFFDQDWYKITQGQVIHNQFPRVEVISKFFDRSGTKYPSGFGLALQAEIETICHCMYPKADELDWIKGNVRYVKPTYLEWLAGYRFNRKEVHVTHDENGFGILVRGPWYRQVYWETVLMSTVSELYYQMTHQGDPQAGWKEKIKRKTEYLSAKGCYWADFGTRRRFSSEVQDEVVRQMAGKPGFLGTSNPYLAMKYSTKPIGTYAHEGPMAMQAAYGYLNCNRMWMDAWVREYEGDLGIALPDTVTSDYFFKHQFNMMLSKLFDGTRQDSGQPDEYAEKQIQHYKSMQIDPKSKKFVPSDGLTPEKLAALNDEFSRRIMVSGGIGTNFTNDVGVKPLNIVIKLIAADFGNGMRGTVKLSDEAGKHTGRSQDITACKEELFSPWGTQ